jgi:hypothetical protein
MAIDAGTASLLYSFYFPFARQICLWGNIFTRLNKAVVFTMLGHKWQGIPPKIWHQAAVFAANGTMSSFILATSAAS